MAVNTGCITVRPNPASRTICAEGRVTLHSAVSATVAVRRAATVRLRTIRDVPTISANAGLCLDDTCAVVRTVDANTGTTTFLAERAPEAEAVMLAAVTLAVHTSAAVRTEHVTVEAVVARVTYTLESVLWVLITKHASVVANVSKPAIVTAQTLCRIIRWVVPTGAAVHAVEIAVRDLAS